MDDQTKKLQGSFTDLLNREITEAALYEANIVKQPDRADIMYRAAYSLAEQVYKLHIKLTTLEESLSGVNAVSERILGHAVRDLSDAADLIAKLQQPAPERMEAGEFMDAVSNNELRVPKGLNHNGILDWMEAYAAHCTAAQPAPERIGEEKWYQEEAARLLSAHDVAEVASALEVRDVACAQFVKVTGLTHEPEDADVIKWLGDIHCAAAQPSPLCPKCGIAIADGNGCHMAAQPSKRQCAYEDPVIGAREWADYNGYYSTILIPKRAPKGGLQVDGCRLREALRKLSNEVSGVLSLAREVIRPAIGNTNLSVLELRVKNAKSLLSSTEPEKESK